MAARDSRKNQAGQSVLEFLIVLPMMVGLAVMLIKMNTAVQVSIVNQQYARAHTLWLAFNSNEYPEVKLRIPQLISKNYNKMILGISENSAPASGEIYLPEVIKMKITPGRSLATDAGDQQNQEEPERRSIIRVRTSVSLCTQSNFVTAGGEKVPLGAETLREGFNPSGFEYCRSPLDG
ncbi:hypothetical protein K2X30_03050 [bacterium]|nr:hypothetical protein [bacterium]